MSDSYEAQFDKNRIPFLFSKVGRKDGTGGHIRLFGSKPPNGWVIYTYHNQAGPAPGWAQQRVWNFVLFAVHHIGPGKATDPEGWHITFGKLRLSAAFIKADTFSTGKRP